MKDDVGLRVSEFVFGGDSCIAKTFIYLNRVESVRYKHIKGNGGLPEGYYVEYTFTSGQIIFEKFNTENECLDRRGYVEGLLSNQITIEG